MRPNFKHIVLRAAVAFVLALLTWACGEDTIDRRYTDYRTDIVTYLGVSDGGAEFELLRRDDSTAITLQSNVTLNSSFKPGTRVLLRYDWADNLADGAMRRIDAYHVASIVSDSLRYTIKPLNEYLAQMEPVRLLSLWRTGDYVNLRCQAEYTGKSRHFYLLLDSATWQHDTVDCYLVNNTHGDTTYHWREAYASFYVGNIWHRSTCRTLRIHMNDVAHPSQTTYDFTKITM